jgi:hypothetical protein
MHQYDATLKQLFERSARGLLRTLTGGAAVTTWINPELPSVRVPRMDLFGRLNNGQLLNIEFQTTNEKRLAERVGVYYLETRMRRDDDAHIEQIVLYLGKEPMRMRSTIDSPSMRFQFRLIDIGDLDGDELAASGDLGDAMLAVLARVKSRRAAIRRALDKLAKLEGKQRELAIEQLAILAGLRGLELELVKEARKYMPFVVDLMENRIFRSRYERGLADGEARGEARGERKVLRTLLKKRFGRLPVWAQKRLDEAATEQIEAWSLKLLDAGKLEDVLGKH